MQYIHTALCMYTYVFAMCVCMCCTQHKPEMLLSFNFLTYYHLDIKVITFLAITVTNQIREYD